MCIYVNVATKLDEEKNIQKCDFICHMTALTLFALLCFANRVTYIFIVHAMERTSSQFIYIINSRSYMWWPLEYITSRVDDDDE